MTSCAMGNVGAQTAGCEDSENEKSQAGESFAHVIKLTLASSQLAYRVARYKRYPSGRQICNTTVTIELLPLKVIPAIAIVL